MTAYVILLAACAIAYGLVTYLIGHAIGYDRAMRDEHPGHRHRKGDPQETVLLKLPTAGRLPVSPTPGFEQLKANDGRPDWNTADWYFFGRGIEVEPSPGPAEYDLLTQTATCPDCRHANDECRCGPGPGELLTQTAEQPVSVTGEPPIDTGEIQAIDDRVTAWIEQWCAQGNYDRHTIQAGD